MKNLARLHALWVAALAWPLVAACDEDHALEQVTDAQPARASDANAPGVDAAPDATVNAASAPDANAADSNRCTGELPVMLVRDVETSQWLEPDWRCYEHDAPSDPDSPARTLGFRLAFPTVGATPTADVTALLNMLVAGAQIDVFFAPSTLGTPAKTLVFDTYESTLDVPAGATSFAVTLHGLTRDVPGLSLVEQRHYGIAIPAAATQLQTSFTLRDSHELSANLALSGGVEDPEKATITALVRDCGGRNVHGARMEIMDMDTGAALPTGGGPGAVRESYVQFALPSTECTYTTADWPAWIAFDAPVNVQNGAKQHSYLLRVQGRMRASDREPRVFAERELELFAGAITSVANFERVRP